MTTEIGELRVRARAAGLRGESYQDWLWELSDADGEAVCALRDAGDHSVEEAHREGARAWKVAGGWVSVWTTAPADYDCFGTEEVEQCGAWRGKVLRRVLAHPHHADYQEGRYGSGLHFSGREDPRIEEARLAERVAAEARERAAAEGRRAGGLFWLRELPDAEVEGEDEDALAETVFARGCSWQDVRAERRRRLDARVAVLVAADWRRCRALVPDGVTLVDDGSPGERGKYGWIPGRAAAVFPDVRVRQHYDLRYRDDASQAEVVAFEGGQASERLGSLADVARRIEDGSLRLAREGEVFPPRPVLARLDLPLKEVLSVDAGGGAQAWVGRLRLSFEAIVLDERGRLVRKKAVVERALRALRERDFGGAS